MPIDFESPEARQFRNLSQNLDFAKFPDIKLPSNPRVDHASSAYGGKGFQTMAYFRLEVPHGGRPSTYENKPVIVLVESKDDISKLVDTAPKFKVPHFGIDYPDYRSTEGKLLAWLNPDAFYGIKPDEANPYISQLLTSQIPTIDLSAYGENRQKTFNKISADNSAAIRKLGKTSEDRQPLDKLGLMKAVDKYDIGTEYGKKYQGMLLNFINMQPFDMRAFSVLTPSQRAEFLAIPKPEAQAKYLSEGLAHGLSEVRGATGGADLAGMLRELKVLEEVNQHPTSDNDMEQMINQLTKGKDLAKTVRRKLMYGVNLTSAELFALTYIEPPQRLRGLLQPDDLTTQALEGVKHHLGEKLRQLPEERRRPLYLWAKVDTLRAA